MKIYVDLISFLSEEPHKKVNVVLELVILLVASGKISPNLPNL